MTQPPDHQAPQQPTASGWQAPPQPAPTVAPQGPYPPPSGPGPCPPQGQYPSPPPAAPSSAAPYAPLPKRPVPAGSKGPIVLLTCGILAAVLAGMLGVGALFSLARISSSFQALQGGQPSSVTLEANESYGIYGDGSFALLAQCSVQGPDGEDVTLTSTASSNVDVDDHRLMETFRTEEAGTYTVECSEAYPTSSTQIIYVSYAASVQGIMGSVVGMLAGFFLGLIGLCLAVGGGIWWAVRSSARKRERQSPQAAAPTIPAV